MYPKEYQVQPANEYQQEAYRVIASFCKGNNSVFSKACAISYRLNETPFVEPIEGWGMFTQNELDQLQEIANKRLASIEMQKVFRIYSDDFIQGATYVVPVVLTKSAETGKEQWAVINHEENIKTMSIVDKKEG